MSWSGLSQALWSLSLFELKPSFIKSLRGLDPIVVLVQDFFLVLVMVCLPNFMRYEVILPKVNTFGIGIK